jgi:hypothetical protein
MGPSGQRLDAAEPRADILVFGGHIETEFIGRIVEITDQREVGDGRLRPEDEGAAREALVENAERAVAPAFEEFDHGRIAPRLGEPVQEAIRSERAVELLVVENYPAPDFQLLFGAARQKFPRTFGEISQDHAGLAELFAPVDEHGSLAHFVDRFAILRRARCAVEEIDEDRLPIGADETKHQRHPIRVARLGEAMELIFRHDVP